MPFEIVRNDITHMQVDAIVNTANPNPVVGAGVDAAIHMAAGPELLAAREKIGAIRVGDAAVTPGFRLPAGLVIHTVGPVWQGGNRDEEKLLAKCYETSLQLARKRKCSSVAFPIIGAGNYGFPNDLALQVAIRTIQAFLMKHEMQVYLVVFSRETFRLSEKLFSRVSSFIDEHYVDDQAQKQYGLAENRAMRRDDLREELCQPRQAAAELKYSPMVMRPCAPSFAADEKAAPAAKRGMGLPALRKPKPTLAQLLRETDAGFSETLLTLIDRTGKKDSEIYTRANVSRQHFSKIRNNPDYKPTKTTALAFAIALELNLEQTQDLIGRAGYALTNSSKFDVIIMYFIRERNYNLFDINAALFEFDQSLLGV